MEDYQLVDLSSDVVLYSSHVRLKTSDGLQIRDIYAHRHIYLNIVREEYSIHLNVIDHVIETFPLIERDSDLRRYLIRLFI